MDTIDVIYVRLTTAALVPAVLLTVPRAVTPLVLAVTVTLPVTALRLGRQAVPYESSHIIDMPLTSAVHVIFYLMYRYCQTNLSGCCDITDGKVVHLCDFKRNRLLKSGLHIDVDNISIYR